MYLSEFIESRGKIDSLVMEGKALEIDQVLSAVNFIHPCLIVEVCYALVSNSFIASADAKVRWSSFDGRCQALQLSGAR